jgi:hypothetical protein
VLIQSRLAEGFLQVTAEPDWLLARRSDPASRGPPPPADEQCPELGFAREIPVLLSASSSEPPVGCVVQYAVRYRRLDDSSYELQTEMWMEPHTGYFAFPGPSAAGGVGGVENKFIDLIEFFEYLSFWFYCSDLHVLSAVSTFDFLIAKKDSFKARGQGKPRTNALV